MEWLDYRNQGSIRNDPLSADLVNALSFLPSMGISMRVHSGGQEAAGQGGNRTGSIRHDHGNAADVEFVMQDGSVLDGTNPAHRPIIAQIVGQARANGVEGWGWGTDYMGPTRFHLGFGNPAVWGAGGSSANAEDWWRQAYNSGSYEPTNALAASQPSAARPPQMGQPAEPLAPTNALTTPYGAQPMDENALRLATLQAASELMPRINQLDPQSFMSSRRFG